MKWPVISSLLCLALGFLLGHQAFPPSPDPSSAPPVTRSERNPNPFCKRRVSLGKPPEQDRTVVPRFDRLSVKRRLLFQNRPRESMVSLSSKEIIGLRERLLDEERKAAKGETPRPVSNEMIAFLAKWHEIEGPGVLDWIEQFPDWSAESKFDARMLVILENFHRDPEKSFEAAVAIKTETAKQFPEDIDPFAEDYFDTGKFTFDLIYEVGTWSPDPLSHFQILNTDNALVDRPIMITFSDFEPGGLTESRRHEVPNPYLKALAHGLFDSHRENLAYQFAETLEAPMRERFTALLDELEPKDSE